MEPPGSSNARRRMQSTMQQPSMPTAAQFGPIVDGKRQCLHCPAQLTATEVSNPTHLRTHSYPHLRTHGFLSSTATAEIAKTESCVASKLPASSTQNLPTLPTPTHALFNWVVQEAIPFSVVESPAFQAFVTALNPSFVLPSRYSMSGHMLLEEYAAVKAEVASRLAALPFVAITVDGWSQKQGAEHCLA
ncbi:zinc finger BED domain-containing 1-like, partial [Haematococcus lacustris]